MKLKEIKKNPDNPRVLKDDKFKKLLKSIEEFPQMMELRPIVVDENNIILGGNMRYEALRHLKKTEIPDSWVKKASELTEEQKREFIIKDNIGFGEWDWDLLANEWDVNNLDDWGLDISFICDSKTDNSDGIKGTLRDRFVVPPFSVLDTRSGEWKELREQWLKLGIKSELGRDATCVKFSNTAEEIAWAGQKTGISIFDPLLCEIMYKWFNVKNGVILDPFAGGSVRGIVADILGYKYFGNDLSEKQINANKENALSVIGSENSITWEVGDSLNIDKIFPKIEADFVFSCPPYHDLEKYTDKDGDLSNMDYDNFIIAYKKIIKKSLSLLKNNRFACFVVGDVRDDNGCYKNFVSDTITAFIDCDVKLYNELILVNNIGAKAIGANGYMKTRKVGKVHQNVLVFYKGDVTKIKENYPQILDNGNQNNTH